jgi:hypothetical protein
MKQTKPNKALSEFSFHKPAVYKIEVQGELSGSFTERLAGMQINVLRKQGTKPISVLVGQINDQAALSGILTTLYDFQFTIISVIMLKENLSKL